MLEILDRQESDHMVISLSGLLVAAHCDALRVKAKELVAQGVKHIRIDMSGVKAIDSSGIGLLAAVHNSLNKIGGTLVVMQLSEEMYQFLIRLRLNNHFTIEKMV
jgi:anti-sigma B factor antagonist